MRLDHVSYVASHDQISDVVNRIGSQIGTAFVDGGIHPKFGTRNFTAPLLNGQYIEVVCPLDHPATDTTPFGKLVKKKSDAGGGWLAWVLSTNDIAEVEKNFGRKSSEGARVKPDGTWLKWKQIGIEELDLSEEMPFFIEWTSDFHPSKDGNAISLISKIMIISENELRNTWYANNLNSKMIDISIDWHKPNSINSQSGIYAVEFEVKTQKILIV
jgi:hypothetical protein